MESYYGINVKQKRESLLLSEKAKKYIDEIIAFADMSITEDNPAFKLSDYILFSETGNRSKFETIYFRRRRKCNSLMMAYWLTEDEKYLKPLIDYIGSICDEFTWCLPAHNAFPTAPSGEIIENVDLFQAETARFFAEIVMCVGDKLPGYILDRMGYEIRRRIFASFEKGKEYFWENCKMNWATVCGAGCTMAALYFGTDEEKEKYVSRFINCLDSYLEGINDDGCCQEGAAYWSYGFSHFVILAQAIKIYTDNKIDYFKNPKVKKLALYPQKTRMSDSKAASFSDGEEHFEFRIGLISFLKSLYDEVSLPDLKYGIYRGNLDSVSEFLWFDENYRTEERTNQTNYFDKTQWYIKQSDKYSFAGKGGHNNEPHNHNDIGAFMITVGDEIFISDLGCGEYVKETFREETRYNFVQNSSRGHSVPVINGEYQCAGEEFSAKNATATDDSFELDIEGAYACGIVDRVHRRFAFSDDKIVLTDVFVYSSKTKSVTERFISKTEPVVTENGTVDFRIGKIKYDSQKFDVKISTEKFVAHNATDILTVYMTDFLPKDKTISVFEFEFEV